MRASRMLQSIFNTPEKVTSGMSMHAQQQQCSITAIPSRNRIMQPWWTHYLLEGSVCGAPQMGSGII